MKLREEKGYTYGASAGWDLRRGRGPFAARAAVNGEATTPAIQDILAELNRIRDDRVTDDELRAARDFLIGVFPIRFETPGAVLGALAGLAVHELPDEELTRYREHIEAVTADGSVDAVVIELGAAGPLETLKTLRAMVPGAAVLVVTDPDRQADGSVAIHAVPSRCMVKSLSST